MPSPKLSSKKNSTNINGEEKSPSLGQSLVPVVPTPPLIDPRRSIRPNQNQKAFFALYKCGKNKDEIAGFMKVKPEEVEHGILIFKIWMGINDPDVARAKVSEEVMRGIHGAGRRLQAAQRATRVISPETLDEKGNIKTPRIEETDHTTVIAAIRAAGELYDKFQEKKGTEVNLGVQTNVGGGANASGHSFEERLRLLRERRGLKNDNPDLQHTELVDDEEIVDGEFEEVDDGEDDGEEES